MNIRQLEIVATVIEKKSITQAARSLELSQSNVSHTLARARKLLEDEIVVPDNGKMEPSSKALSLYPKIKRIVALSRASESVRSDVLKGQTKTIRIYSPTEIVEIWGVRIVEGIRKAGFKGSVSFPRTTSKSYRRMEQDPFSLAVRPAAVLPEEMMQRKIYEASWSLVCAPGHPLANRTSLHYEDAQKYDFVVVRPFDGVPHPVDIMAALRGERRKIPVFVKLHHEMVPFLLTGNMIGITPTSNAKLLSQLHPTSLAVVDSIQGVPSFSVSMAWYPQFSQNAISTQLRDIVFKVMSSDQT